MQNAPEVEANAELPKMFHKKIGFAIVDTQQGQDVARHCGVSATPTFQFYLKGQKNNEVKGANVGELKMQTVLLLDAAYPREPCYLARPLQGLKYEPQPTLIPNSACQNFNA